MACTVEFSMPVPVQEDNLVGYNLPWLLCQVPHRSVAVLCITDCVVRQTPGHPSLLSYYLLPSTAISLAGALVPRSRLLKPQPEILIQVV